MNSPLPPAEADRLRYLDEVVRMLWPPPASVRVGTNLHRDTDAGGADGSGTDELILVPHTRRPRLLVPAARRPAAAAMMRYGESTSPVARTRSGLLAAALACGAGGRLMRARVRVHAAGSDTLVGRLEQALGRRFLVSMHLGPPRANRKPVLQLLTPGGETVAFVKIGVNELTRTLVRAEREALEALARAELRHLRTPQVLHHEQWNGMELLVLSALPVWRARRPLAPTRLGAAMVEVARTGETGPLRLTSSPYWQHLQGRLDGVHTPDTAGAADTAGKNGREALAAAVTAIGRRAGELSLNFGAWHGDWTPWNMASRRDELLVWDWERFGGDVPLGFDALHYRLQDEVTRRRGRRGLPVLPGPPGDRDSTPRGAAHRLVRRSALLLEPFAIGRDEAHVTALLYLVELAARWLEDGQQRTGARLGGVDDWLIPALMAEVERL